MNSQIWRYVAAFCLTIGFAAAANAAPVVGQPAPDFTATDISGKVIKLSDFRGRIVVIEAYDSQCLYVRKEYDSGAMQELQRQVASNGVAWLILNPGLHPRLDTPAQAQMERASFNMTINDWIIDDRAQSLCKRYGVRVTPQMFVIDKDGTLAYSGAIDNAQTPRDDRLKAHNYVRQAVNELLSGRQVSVPHVKPIGCMIMYPGMSQFQLMRPMN